MAHELDDYVKGVLSRCGPPTPHSYPPAPIFVKGTDEDIIIDALYSHIEALEKMIDERDAELLKWVGDQ
jgi:hypothetical protein